MGDAWLSPDTCGVKLAEFEQMTRQMTRAAPALATLADQLWQTLNAAGVSTAPALEIRRLAAWATDAASDLRRRNLLAHDMDRQPGALRFCGLDGTYLTLPDRFTDQVAQYEGIRVADVLRRAAAGDRSAWDELNRIRPEDVTPAFAKALMASLGPGGLVSIPVALAKQLAGDMNLEPADGSLHHVGDGKINADAANARTALATLARALSYTTDPQSKGYLGDQFLTQLRDTGRAHFPPQAPPGNQVDGYQAVSSVLGASGDARFSPAFFRVVGHDMIAYDRQQRKNSPNVVTDLSGYFHLGNALDAGTTKVVREEGGLLGRKNGPPPQREILSPLLRTAAHSGRDAAQSLISGWHGPFSPKDATITKDSDLYYLVHDLRGDWGRTDHGKSLGEALRTAATGQDEVSTTLALQAAKALADTARSYFTPEVGKNEMRVNGDAVSDLSALRPAMADVLASHMDELHSVYREFHYTTEPSKSGLGNGDLDYALLDICRDAAAYDTLLKAQIVHARLAVDGAVAKGGDLTRNLEDILPSEGWMFGRLVEARTRSVQAEKARLDQVNAELAQRVNQLVGLIPVASLYSKAAAVPGAEAAGAKVTGRLTGVLENWITQRLAEKPDPTLLTPKSNTEAVQRLFTQMIASSMAEHGRFGGNDLRGKSFANRGDRPEMKSLESLGREDLSAFLRWAAVHARLDSADRVMQSTLEQGQKEVASHFGNEGGEHLPPSFTS
ncbi:hypothetical protein DZF91_35210 [Actinomadura logoneensis]|uniref:Uncharacterized protein n=1 Tax=Actinomadura logoneensis TaxID=2293572 RepID=A0A372JB02_9ACTN|nr:hypothetical protein [Actinomadura logoneensis]RFU36994.1 hypothetical protein DZF91_35210 [Actinomadura logoneensis]